MSAVIGYVLALHRSLRLCSHGELVIVDRGQNKCPNRLGQKIYIIVSGHTKILN